MHSCKVLVLFIIYKYIDNSIASDCVKETSCKCIAVSPGWSVDCSDLGLSQVPEGIPNTTIHLYLNNNNIATIENTVLQRLAYLRTLNLDGNPIKVISNTSLKNPSLEKITIGDQLEEIGSFTFANHSRLYEVKIVSSRLQELKPNSFFLSSPAQNTIRIFPCPNLRTIFPGTFRLSPFSSIKIRNTELTSIPAKFVNASYMKTLSLVKGKISHIHPDAFAEVGYIKNVLLSANLLTEIPAALYKLSILHILVLSQNKISSIHDDVIFSESNHSYSPTSIYLQDNNMTYIKNGTFTSTSLQSLYLFDNPINHIDDNSFSHMASYSTVYLNCENLVNIPSVLSRRFINVYCVKSTTEIRFDTYIKIHFVNIGIECSDDCILCKQGHFKRGQAGASKKCLPCPPGGFYLNRIGAYAANNYSEVCKICPDGSFSPNIGAASITDCRPCPSGSDTNQKANLNACECLDAFHRVDRFGECKPCFKGTDCTAGYQTPISGYWWSWDFPHGIDSFLKYKQFAYNLTTDIFDEHNPGDLKNTKYSGLLPAVHKCIRSNSCKRVNKGGRKRVLDTNCSHGYEGWLCAVCSTNHYELFNECYKCKSLTITICILVIIIVVLTGAGYTIWKLNKRRNIPRMDSFFIHLKIAINFYQTLGILSEVNEIYWPEDFQSVGECLQYLDIIRYINVLSPKCIFSDSWNAYASLYIAIATPFFIMLFLFIIFMFLHILYWCREDNARHHLKNKWVSFTLMMMYLTYANTCSNIMAVGPWSIRTFKITSNGEYNKTILTSDYSINLDDDDGAFYNVNKKIVYTSLLYVFGFPLAVVGLLYWRFKRIGELPEEQSRSIGLQFFCRQYKKRFWFWEVVDLYNKAILALIVNFKDDKQSNMSYSLFITVILITLHLYMEPMKEKSEQRLQLLTLIFIIVNLSIGAIVEMDGTLYLEDNTIAVLHEITPFILLLLNLSILFVVFVDLIKKVKEAFCEICKHQTDTDRGEALRVQLIDATDMATT